MAADRADAMCRVAEVLGVDPREVDLAMKDGPKAKMVSASEIAPEQIEWLWPGRIPLGTLTLFSGDPKLGKGLTTLSLAAAVTRGGPLPGPGADGDGPAMAPKGSVVLLSAEDDPASVIVPRLLAAGADMDRVKIIPAIVEPGFDGDPNGRRARVGAVERMPTVHPHDLGVIERQAAELGDCRLMIFDPITAYLGAPYGRPGAATRRMLRPLDDMARRLRASVTLVTHNSKRGASGTNGKYRVLGDIAWVGVCRANFMFLQDPDDPTGRRRLMLDNGRNLGAGQPGLPFVIRDDGAGPFCDWLPETVDLDADAALARAVKAGKSGASGKGARRRECEVWLRGYLADGPKTATECERAAEAAGFSATVLRRARVDLAVRCIRSGFGQGACYHWMLPEAAIEAPAGP